MMAESYATGQVAGKYFSVRYLIRSGIYKKRAAALSTIGYLLNAKDRFEASPLTRKISCAIGNGASQHATYDVGYK
jgi:hypothetical protein